MAVEKGLFADYERCLQDEPAGCSARCPLHVDLPQVMAAASRGDFMQAFAELRKKVPLAGVVCLICDHPCEAVCVRTNLDAAVAIHAIERAIVHFGWQQYKPKFQLARKKGRVAVIGAGPAGLSAALELNRKGFAVELLESRERPGGGLWDYVAAGVITESELLAELEQLALTEINVNLKTSIEPAGLGKLEADFDAVFLASGNWPEALSGQPQTFQVGARKLFAGTGLSPTGDSLITTVAVGKRAAISIERFIQKKSLTAEREREGTFTSQLSYSLDAVPACFRVIPGAEATDYRAAETGARAADYTAAEAAAEASRCLRCECDACVRACPHLQRFGRKPKTYAREIFTNENVFLGTRYANTMINSCTLCGLCQECCPIDLGMVPLIRQAREKMVETAKMPPTAHDFAFRDMAFSNSAQFFLARARGDQKPSYCFFPGCQLAASSPEHVEAAYAYLLKATGDTTALCLGCCGAPADWAGRSDLMAQTSEQLRTAWFGLGQPMLIMACSSCLDVFARYLPDVPTLSLWEFISAQGLDESAVLKRSSLELTSRQLSIHDACATRHNKNLQDSVRNLAKELGFSVTEPHYTRTKTKCCGYGGDVFFANRKQADDFARDGWAPQVSDCNAAAAGDLACADSSATSIQPAAEAPTRLVYCAMCQDLYVNQGHRCLHLLDLLFAPDLESAAARTMPTLSERQRHRAQLKRRLLMAYWNNDAETEAELESLGQLPGDFAQVDFAHALTIRPDVKAAMEERLILDADIIDVITDAEVGAASRFLSPTDGSYLAHKRRQFVTYWVRYKKTDVGFEVLSAYSHRMQIVDEN